MFVPEWNGEKNSIMVSYTLLCRYWTAMYNGYYVSGMCSDHIKKVSFVLKPHQYLLNTLHIMLCEESIGGC
mgnify:CR=1 FL=1